MKSLETPLHKVQGMGSAHSGTGHFWRQRVTAVALIPLGLWFLFSVLGLAGATEVAAIQYFTHIWNAILMAAFIVIMLYHLNLGLRVVIDDYVHTPGMKITLLLLRLVAVLLIGAVNLFALIKIAVL